MTAKKFSERSWWRRLARRTRAAEPRSNRLSHFEPLEPRMVLSAGIWMDGGDFWHGPHHEEFRLEKSEEHQAAEYGAAADRQFFAGPPISFASYEEIEYSETVFAPHQFGDGPMSSGPQNSSSGSRPEMDYGPETADGESMLAPTLLPPALISPAAPMFSMPAGPIAPSNFAWYLSAVPAYEFHVLIVPDEYTHSSANVPVVLQAPSARPITIVPSSVGSADVGFASLMAASLYARRVENPPPDTNEHHGVPGPVSEELTPGASKSAATNLAAQESGSILAVLSLGNAARLTDYVHFAATDDDSSASQRPLVANAAAQSEDDANGEPVELATDEAIAAKRKLASGSELRSAVQSRLDGLVDLPVVRVTESLFRELLVMYDNASQAQAQAAATSGMPDDGLVELLAADVSSLASRRIALPPSSQSDAVTLEGNVELYQSLQIAGLDDIASAVVQSQAAPVDQIAKAD